MQRLFFGILMLAAPSLLFGQLDSNTLTIAASSVYAMQPDQVVFTVAVNSNLDVGLDQVVSALSALGITASNLSSVTSSGILPPMSLEWSFTLPVPLSKMKDTVSLLTSLQVTNLVQGPVYGLDFQVQGTQVSTEAQQAQRDLQCPAPDLMADAKVQAQKLATAAGFVVGQILSISDGPVAIPSAGAYYAIAKVPNSVSGTPITISGLLALYQSPPNPTLNCSLIVKFQLLRYQ